MKKRTWQVKRKTKETRIELKINLDGKGESKIDTSIGFLDHMLTLLAKHSLFDLDIKASGDLKVDAHHTVEDIGISLGKAVKKALGKKKGINRFASIQLPMDEALASVALDISDRPFLNYSVKTRRKKIGNFDLQLVKEFLRALVNNCGITLHIKAAGENAHHIFEAIFKGLGRTLGEATAKNPRIKGIPSTKGKL
jgi:imidazoleglycerol-phosphate dehydratase